MTIIPYSSSFDQATLSKLLDADPVVQRYRDFLALFAWHVVPEPVVKPSQPGKRPHPNSAYVKALLLKRHEGFAHCTTLRQYLLEHPLLVLELGFRPVLDVSQPYGFDVKRTVPSDRWFREQQRTLQQSMLQDLLAATVQALREEIPGLGEVVAFDTTHIYAWVRENNLRVYVKDRYKKEVQPHGDPDCRLGVKKGSNQDKGPSEPAAAQGQEQASARTRRGKTPQSAKDAQPDSKKPCAKKSDDKKDGKECLWGYGSGVASATVAGYGDVVLAELTQPFNENDVSYFVSLYIRSVAALGGFPLHITADAAFDARSRLSNGGSSWRHRGRSSQRAWPPRERVCC